MELRHVVTSFLLNALDGSILLGRRSDRVATYPGHWAAISGSIEEGEASRLGQRALEQAYREIREETGLDSSDAELLAEGWPLRFADWGLGVVWVVHPFLFRCRAPERVRPDWEHVRFEWVEPSGIARLQAVPKLAEAYQSAAAQEGGRDSSWIFREIRQDRQHGAEELGLWTLEGLRRRAEEGARTGLKRPAQMLSAMTEACREAALLRPSMAPVRSAALSVFGICRDVLGGCGAGPEGEAVTEGLAGRIAGLLARREEDSLTVASRAALLIPQGARLLTLSCSFTVLLVLRESARKVSRLVVAESRPRCEGRETARLASSFGIPTDLVTDAAAVSAIRQADLLIFGADALCGDGSVVNKMGTFALCCAARHFGVPTVCVATESKVLPAGFAPPLEEMEPEELGPAMPGVVRRNVYFEAVPGELVGRVITGAGLASPAGLSALAEGLRELQDSLLG